MVQKVDEVNLGTASSAGPDNVKPPRGTWTWLARDFNGLAVFLILFMAVVLVGDLINHRFHQTDFGAYLQAAYRFLDGEMLYNREPGFVSKMPYKYAPGLAGAFAVFTLFGVQTARVLWYLLNCTVVFLLLFASRDYVKRLTEGRVVAGQAVLFIAVLATGEFIYRDISIGNVNALVSLLMIGGSLAALRGRDGWAGLLFGVAMLFKPHYGFLLLYFLLFRKWKIFVAFLAVWVAATVIPLPFYGMRETVALFREWIHVIQVLNAAGSWIHPMYGMNTVFEVLAWPFRLMGWQGVPASPLYPAVIMALLVAAIIFLHRSGKRAGLSPYFSSLAVIAITPVFWQVDINNFIFLLPVILLLLAQWRSQPVMWRMAVVAGLVLLGGNLYELWGRRLHVLFYESGVYGIGTVLLLATLLAIRWPLAPAAQVGSGKG